MGTVYLAEQTQPFRRRVAVKLIRFGGADVRVLRRFEAEQQALARLGHPNVAQVFDAGITEYGQPFFVLEYVAGLPLNRYCEQHGLSLRDRLDLFVSVCEAVQHAHERGILHRDLKPSNVMVTAEGTRHIAKVIDFGVAKSLGEPLVDGTLFTGDQMVGTPAYMSPEAIDGAAGGLELDARADVYALGVMLYELLAGLRPFDNGKEGYHRVIQRILNETPTAPSKRLESSESQSGAAGSRGDDAASTGWRRQLRSGLDRIALKALSRDRADRYPSAAALAADVRRFLMGDRPEASGDKVPRLRWLPGALVASLLLLVPAGLWWLSRDSPDADAVSRGVASAGAAAMGVESIAILPLTDLSPGGDQEFLSDGMTEALIEQLASIRSLRVISRSSVMAYKNGETPLPEIARKLNVQTVLEGSVQRVGGRVRVAAKLIHAPTEALLWSKSYERPAEDLLTLQREVAMAIADEIQVKLTADEQNRLSAQATVAPEAYESYLRGRFFWNRRTRDGVLRALDYFQDAVQQDPSYALAYVGLADSYSLLPPFAEMSPEEAYSMSKEHALMALQMDQGLGAAHASLALVMHEHDWDWQGAEEHYREAIELDPSYATAYQWYAEMLSREGRHEEAQGQIEKALEIDPLSLIANAIAGWTLYNAGRLEEAETQLVRAIELDGSFVPPHGYLGLTFLEVGRFEEAQAELLKAFLLSRGNPRYRSELGVARARSGDLNGARADLEELHRLHSETPVAAFHFARLYLALGETELALAALERAVEERGVWPLFFRVDPLLKELRGTARFEALLEKVHFPPSS